MIETDSQVVQALKQWKLHPQSPQSLHEHLCEMLNNISSNNVNGMDHFERVSEYFKKVRFRPKEETTEQEIEEKGNEKICYPNWLNQQERIIGKITKSKANFSEKIIANFQRQAQTLFQPIGISFGGDQNYKITLSLKLLAEKYNTSSLRFWGKILTKTGDYFVIQGVSKKKKQPVITQGMERYRQGVNSYSFWVAQNVMGEDWYQLPLVTPEQIKISRLIKYVFSGKLNESVKSYPHFPGEERHLLKCQLVRITHNCEIVPNGLYSPLEDNAEEVGLAEEFKMPEFNDLANLENWVHLNPYILGVGRSDYYMDPKLPEEQKDELLGKLQQADPKMGRLKGINEDKPYEKFGLETAWTVKQVGNLQVFSGKQEGTSNIYGSIVLKNPHWPGWQTVANGRGFASIYIGYGYKLTQECFHPSSPEDLQNEGVDGEEHEEPNPRNPPDQLEPDSDEENKKEEEK